MQTILIVEDDTEIIDFLQPELLHEGFNVITAKDGREALEKFEHNNIELILLDIMLPKLNGSEVLRRIRKNSDVPIIMLTAKSETYEKINGLNSGADDYVTKPFEIEELLARMRTILRRIQKSPATDLIFKQLVISQNLMEAKLAGKNISLSKTEFMLLKYFVEHQNTVLTRDEIISNVWGKDHYIEENAVDVYIGYLRSKIDKIVNDDYITTVRGLGYIMKG